jgi:hypothetical protein
MTNDERTMTNDEREFLAVLFGDDGHTIEYQMMILEANERRSWPPSTSST